MKLPKETKQALKKLLQKYSSKIEKSRRAIEKRLSKEMADELTTLAKEHNLIVGEYAGLEPEEYLDDIFGDEDENYYGTPSEQMLNLTTLFINNRITQSSIWSDPSGDWDGKNRIDDLSEHVFPKEILDKYVAEHQKMDSSTTEGKQPLPETKSTIWR